MHLKYLSKVKTIHGDNVEATEIPFPPKISMVKRTKRSLYQLQSPKDLMGRQYRTHYLYVRTSKFFFFFSLQKKNILYKYFFTTIMNAALS